MSEAQRNELNIPSGYVLKRPKNGNQVVEYLAGGETIEVPNGYGTKTLGYLQQVLKGSWGADCQTSKYNRGWFAIEPNADCIKECKRFLSHNAQEH
jgi:hypothetical protein